MKMIRNIVQIHEELCTGCGQCILDCAEGAIQIVDGKAKVISDHLCDGLGACIGGCPEGALVIIQRPAEAFDEEAVAQHLAAQGRCHDKSGEHTHSGHHHGHKEHHRHHGHHAKGHHGGDPVCHGGHHEADHECCGGQGHHKSHHAGDHECCGGKGHHKEHHGRHGHAHHHGHHGHEGHHGLRGLAPLEKDPLLKPFTGKNKGGHTQWPLKLRLITPTAPFLQNADISLVADCAAAIKFSLPQEKGTGAVYTLACPKLEGAERITEHLAEVFAQARPNSCTVVHVDIPCCRKLLESVETAKKLAGVDVPIEKTVVTTQGDVQG